MKNYTKKYEQVSPAAARAKFRRMASGVGRAKTNYFECGFASWWIGKDDENENELAIYVSTSYHSESTIDEMYRTNCKVW